jgi:hypothetical protein
MMTKIIKLFNGTEVIGSVLQENNNIIELDNPIQINYKNIESSIPSISLTRYMQFSKTRQCMFEKSKVVNIAEPLEGMISYYNTALHYFKTEIDNIVDSELKRVSEMDTELDQYSAFLEKFNTNQPLH